MKHKFSLNSSKFCLSKTFESPYLCHESGELKVSGICGQGCRDKVASWIRDANKKKPVILLFPEAGSLRYRHPQRNQYEENVIKACLRSLVKVLSENREAMTGSQVEFAPTLKENLMNMAQRLSEKRRLKKQMSGADLPPFPFNDEVFNYVIVTILQQENFETVVSSSRIFALYT
ncbi:unnamed protein product [Caenorhabditis nigoni]